MNLIDWNDEGHLNNMVHKFSLPDFVLDISYGHRMKAALPIFVDNNMISQLESVITYFRQRLKRKQIGIKTSLELLFFTLLSRAESIFTFWKKNWKHSETFRQMATKWLQNIYSFWLPSPSNSSLCSAQKRRLSFSTEWVDALCLYSW